MNVLVLNCGSSSIKYQLLNMDAVPVVLAKEKKKKIGLTYGSFTYKPEGKDKVVADARWKAFRTISEVREPDKACSLRSLR